MFVTAALRNLSAVSASFLLYRCLVPASHPWHFGLLNSFLSLSIWKHISNITFCSYLIHFRLIMELIYSSQWRSFFGISIPAVVPSVGQTIDALVSEWIFLMVKIFVIGTVISFIAAKVLHEMVEKPSAAFIERYVFPRPPKTKKIE